MAKPRPLPDEPISTIVSLDLKQDTRIAAMTCSLGHHNEVSFVEYWQIAFGRRKPTATCPTCRALESLLPGGE